MTLTIAFPSKGICEPEFTLALRLLEIPTKNYFIDCVAGADVAVSRNLLVERAKEKSDYIFFIDDDMLPPPDTISRLLKHKKDITTALTFSKTHPFAPRIWEKNDNEEYNIIKRYQDDSLVRIDACGASCILIKTEVFQKINKPYFWYIPEGEKTDMKGEDIYFCEKAQESGIEIYCDTSLVCKHIGKRFVGKEYWEEVLKNKEIIG